MRRDAEESKAPEHFKTQARLEAWKLRPRFGGQHCRAAFHAIAGCLFGSAQFDSIAAPGL